MAREFTLDIINNENAALKSMEELRRQTQWGVRPLRQ
jgi:hypothetical protein